MPRGDKSAEELFATWLQTYIPTLEETKPAVRDAIQHFTGWPVGWNKELKERAVTPQRLSRLVSRVQSHFGYRSWDDEITVLLSMVQAYRQSQPSENQFSNEAIEQFLRAGSLPELELALPGQGMKPIFFYESIGYLRHRLDFSFLHVRHASLVAEYLEDKIWGEISLMGYLREFLDCVFAEEAKPYQVVDLSDVAKEMVTDWLVTERAPTIALSVGFSQQGDWAAFRALAVEKCLDMSLEELLAIPDPVVAARVLDAMGVGDTVKRAVWEAALPDRLSEEGQGRLNFLFTGSMDSKKTMIDSTWLNESERFKALITPPSRTASQ